MRNSHNITLTNNDSLTEVEDTTWSLPALWLVLSWLCALAIPMLIYGSNTLLFFIYTAFLSGADARRCSGGDCTAFIDGRKATLQYCFHSDDGWHYVWCTVYVAIGLIVLSRLFCS